MKPLRFVSWNCCEAVRFKLPELTNLIPDVAVVLECGIKESFDDVFAEMRPSSVVWVNSGSTKKLGVFGFGDYKAELDSIWDESITHIAPVRITGPVSFNLLATYAIHSQEPGEKRNDVVGPLLRAIAKYQDFIASSPTVVAGDFNNHVQWDMPGKANNHQNAVDELGKLGLVSAYHAFNSLVPGPETHPTFYHQRNREKPYHIDYCFVPQEWQIKSCTVGEPDAWLKFSDHMPITVDLLVT